MMRIERSLSNTWLLLVMIFLPLLMAQSVQAQVKHNQSTAINSGEISSAKRKIRRRGKIERLATNTSGLLSQSSTPQATPASGIVLVTAVKANPTDKGVEVILQTTKGEQLQVTNRSTSNNFIADIPNAQLRLLNGDGFTFRSDKPLAGITEIRVTNFDANTIRVTVIGEAGLPTVELFDSDEGLIFGLTPAVSSAQQPQPKPEQEQSTSERPLEQPSTSDDQPIELVVTGEQDGYRVPNTSTATKTDTPLRDIPASIQIVPRQVLQDQKAVRLQDAVQNVSGVTQAGNYGGTGAGGYIIRGFAQYGNFRNGFRDANFYTLSDIANLERVEVLKGPASVLFGQAEPGGIINLVTKQPLSEPYYAADFTAGSYDFYRPTLDISGPLNTDKTLLYRLNVAYENSRSFRDFIDTERIFIAPSLTWNIGTNTTLTFDFEYLYNDSEFDGGIVAIGNRPAPIPIGRFLGVPEGNDSKSTAYRAGYRLEHRFSENWQLRNAFSITINQVNDFRTEPGSLINDQFLERTLENADFETNTYSLQTEVIGKFATGSITHQPLLGIELNRTIGSSTFSEGIFLPPIDIFSPVNDSVIPTDPLEATSKDQSRTDTLGIYLQDQITLLDNLKLLVGGRFDFTDQKYDDLFASTSTSQSDQAFSPRIGIVYQPIPPISLYASYSRSFVPVIGNSADNSVFEPQRGTQYEVGVKVDLNERLSTTLAVYQITKTNVLTTDLSNPSFSIQVGEQRSRGVELDVAGEILTGWKIIASYAYTDAQITEDNQFPVGNLLNNVARHSASLWTTYEIQQGSLQGLGFGLGLYYVGDREGDLDNSFVLPSYFRTDAALYYQRNNWKAAINIKNLFDEKYYETSEVRTSIYPGAPLTVLGTISWEF